MVKQDLVKATVLWVTRKILGSFPWHVLRSFEELKSRINQKSNKLYQSQCLKFIMNIFLICFRTQNTDQKKVWKFESKRLKGSLLKGSVCSQSKVMKKLHSILSMEHHWELLEPQIWMQLHLEHILSQPLLSHKSF